MKRPIIVLVVLAAVGAGVYYRMRSPVPAGGPGDERTGTGGAAGRAGGFTAGRGGARLPMTVELSTVQRANMSQTIMVVGNLIGLATVETTPKVNGRLEAVSVRLGDRVTRGQRLAKIEDSELLEQIKQAEASFAVGAATIRQREADLGLARTNLDRSRNLFERQLIPKQTFDDADARYQAAEAQLDLARAQYQQSQARIDELKINLANTIITSPVNGFIGKRTLDPGAWVTPNSVFLSVVDISAVRMVVNVVEKDLRRMTVGLRAQVEVDAFPDEKFTGRVAQVAPVLDPSTRTAQIEIEIPNGDVRLKPGMYARVNFTIDRHDNALVVPVNAVVDYQGKRGVFQASKGERGDVARFKAIEFGIANQAQAEVAFGLAEGDRIVTTGAAGLREGDRIVLAATSPQPDEAGRGERAGGRGNGGRSGTPSESQAPANSGPPGPVGREREGRPVSGNRS